MFVQPFKLYRVEAVYSSAILVEEPTYQINNQVMAGLSVAPVNRSETRPIDP